MKIIYTISEAEKELSTIKECEVKIEVEAQSLVDSANTFKEELNTNLKLITEGIIIPKTDGSKFIFGDSKTFKSYIDSDFKNWGLNKKSEKTKEAKVNVFELIKDSTFKQIFTDPEKQVMTQHQIIEFCNKHPQELRQNGYATFFLIKVDGEYFVVSVSVFGGGLSVGVLRLELGGVWDGEYRHRVVSPQL